MKRDSAGITSSNFFEDENEKLKDLSKEDFVRLICEYKKREFAYLSNISSLEKELSTLLSNINECKYVNKLHNYSKNEIKDVFFDPTTHLEIKELRSIIVEKNDKIRKLNEELTAKQFHAQSIMGQKIIKKCKKLQEENSELGRIISMQNTNVNMNINGGNLIAILDNESTNVTSLSNNINNKTKYIVFLKNELKQLRELNMEMDCDNEALTKKISILTTNYSTIKNERDEAQRLVNDLKMKLKKQGELNTDKDKKLRDKERERSLATERNRNAISEKKTKNIKDKDKHRRDRNT